MNSYHFLLEIYEILYEQPEKVGDNCNGKFRNPYSKGEIENSDRKNLWNKDLNSSYGNPIENL